jgi:hypothetical protein
MPSDIQAQLNHTNPAHNLSTISNALSSLLLFNLDQVNNLGNCTQLALTPSLTSKDNVRANPSWLPGVLPEPVTFETVRAKSCAVIVNDHGSGIVDAFYMYFYAFTPQYCFLLPEFSRGPPWAENGA